MNLERSDVCRTTVILAMAALLATACGGAKATVTTGTLFEEMADLEALARLPEPAYRTFQFSSFDRRSRVPAGPDWFANADGFGGEPVPNFEQVLVAPKDDSPGEYLMADIPGPGAIVRLWTAALSGRVRVYIDDMARPLYDGEAEPFFRGPYDTFPGLAGIDTERFRSTVYQRDASYAPIPFADRLRVVWRGKLEEIHFYHLEVRRYAAGTAVRSFSPEDIVTYKDAIDRATLALTRPDELSGASITGPARPIDITVPPGETRTALELGGPGALERFWLHLDAGRADAALRQTILRIVCDGSPRGQVESPVGDFFGAAPGVNPYESLPFSVREDGRMICRFVMPFEKSLRIAVENLGAQTVRVSGEALFAERPWDARTMHFRAAWRVDHDLVASNTDVQDLPFLLARGSGAYVGSASILLNPAVVPSSWGNWWGEGDEKVFIDDDEVPSIFGTGSEDYYNYSWSAPDIFFFPYCGQPRNDGPGNRGFVTDFRWHILDRIPFARSIAFFMELNSHEPTPGLSYARTAYYYARPGTIDDHPAIMPADVRELRLPEGWQPAARFGARNSVFFQAEDIAADRRNTAERPGALWAGGRLLVWTPERPGERKILRVPMDAAGKATVRITAALTPSSGRFRAWIDGRPAGPDAKPLTVDLFDPFRTLLRTFSLEAEDMASGPHTLVLEYAGADERVARPEIGLDFVWVQMSGRAE